MTRRSPKIIEVHSPRVEELLDRAASKLSDEDALLVRQIVESYGYLTDLLGDKNTSISRLRKLIFGAKTEKASDVLGGAGASANSTSDAESQASDGCNAPERAEASSEPGKEEDPPSAEQSAKKTPPPGHGRRGADDYAGGTQVDITHATFAPGDDCPECQGGVVYEKTPSALVRFAGQAPLHATVYRLQKLRCNLCGKTFTASAPDGVGDHKYDETAASVIGLLKYGSGFPFHRIDRLQQNCEIPLPASTQWEIVERGAAPMEPVYDELIRQAAQGEVVHNDDTSIKILELMGQRAKKSPPADQEDSDRTGMFTSAVVAVCAGARRMALFFSGRRHAGENLADVLRRRAEELEAPIHMCDGLSRNLPQEFKTILANCLAHGRRNFVDLHDRFPEECGYVIEAFQTVYYHDKVARENGLSAEERLAYHQQHSQQTMSDLKVWLQRQLDEKLVEPNSSLGGAIHYLLSRWGPLTLFLRKAGAPLDNNVCERALKKAILHRKNAMFYKTRHGARVGDLYMSLIYTCELCGANALDYLNQLQRHVAAVAANPSQWMPWNYRDMLDAARPVA